MHNSVAFILTVNTTNMFCQKNTHTHTHTFALINEIRNDESMLKIHQLAIITSIIPRAARLQI